MTGSPIAESASSTAAEIPPEECLRLLAMMSVGRIAVAPAGAAPLVVPVNYALDGDVVVFRADRGSRLGRLAGLPVSFEVDLIDPYQKLGWSILVRGTAREATSGEAEHEWVGRDTRQLHAVPSLRTCTRGEEAGTRGARADASRGGRSRRRRAAGRGPIPALVRYECRPAVGACVRQRPASGDGLSTALTCSPVRQCSSAGGWRLPVRPLRPDGDAKRMPSVSST